MSILRAWFNQPSTLQQCHDLNGVNVFVEDKGADTVKVYFLTGEVISGVYPRICLTIGHWI